MRICWRLPLKLLGGHVEAAVWLLASLGVLAVALTYAVGCRVAGHAGGRAGRLADGRQSLVGLL